MRTLNRPVVSPLLFFVAFALCFFSPYSQAQDSNTSHQHAAANIIIDGATHPELIPDSTAYGMYFVSISVGPSPTASDQIRQQAQLHGIGLGEADVVTLARIVAEHRVKRDALIAQYNQAAQAATSDIGTLLQQLAGLVQSTRDMLKVSLSPQGMMQFDAFVQSEKRHMKVQKGAQ
jgi:hypothetical protein